MSNKTRRPGWWYPWIFVGMFTVVVSVNLALAYFATSTFNGLQTERAYEKGLAYNQALAGASAQEKLGWTVKAEVSEQRGPLTVDVADQVGKPIEGAKVFALFIRPTQAGHDSRLELASAGGGRYRGTTDLPFPGLWELQVVVEAGDQSYQLNQRVKLQ